MAHSTPKAQETSTPADRLPFKGSRLPGDFFRPAGRHVRKTLKKYYNELGIPQKDRPLLPLLANGSEVLWLWGSGFTEGVEPDSFTNEVLTVRTEKAGED